VLLAIVGFMPTEGVGAVGSLDCPTAERSRMAKRSLEWKCEVCGVPNRELLSSGTEEEGVQKKAMEEAADIISQMAFKSEGEVQQQKKALSQQQKPQQQQQQQQQQEEENEKEPQEKQGDQQDTDEVVDSGKVSEDVPPATPPVTSSPTDQSDEATAAGEVGGAGEDPETQLRQRPRQTPVVSPSPLTSPSEPAPSGPPGGFSLFLIVLLLICIFILVARRLIIMFLIESS
jgi:hypothetical protein